MFAVSFTPTGSAKPTTTSFPTAHEAERHVRSLVRGKQAGTVRMTADGVTVRTSAVLAPGTSSRALASSKSAAGRPTLAYWQAELIRMKRRR